MEKDVKVGGMSGEKFRQPARSIYLSFFLSMSKHSRVGYRFRNGVWLPKKKKSCGWGGRDGREQHRFQELILLLSLLLLLLVAVCVHVYVCVQGCTKASATEKVQMTMGKQFQKKGDNNSAHKLTTSMTTLVVSQ